MSDREKDPAYDLATQVLNQLADPVFVKDEEHRWIIVNDAFCKLLGRSRNDILGKSDYDFFPKEDADIYRAKDALVFESGQVNENEEPLLDERGVKHIISTKKSAFTTEDGQRRLAGIIRDVTDRRRLEAQLVEAERLASVGTLAAGVAHEINNPLTFVSANLALALESLKTCGTGSQVDEMRECLEDALDGAQRVARIVQDLSALARPAAASEETMSVADAAQAAMRMVSVLTRQRATVRIDVADLPRVIGSESRFCQVLVNLLANATKAFSISAPELNLISISGTRDGERVRVVVHDNGPGISPELLRRVMDPFVSGRDDGGMGLGLAISHAIVQSLGGNIRIASELGRGTTVTVELKTARATDGRGRVTTAPPPVPHVLVVDDEETLLRVARRTLGAHYRVSLADSGAKALEMIEASCGSFDAVLCDLRMPSVSGLDLLDHVRARWPALASRFVFATGGTDGEAMQMRLEATGRSLLAKPYAPDQLRSVIRAVIDEHGQCARLDGG